MLEKHLAKNSICQLNNSEIIEVCGGTSGFLMFYAGSVLYAAGGLLSLAGTLAFTPVCNRYSRMKSMRGHSILEHTPPWHTNVDSPMIVCSSINILFIAVGNTMMAVGIAVGTFL